MILFMQKSKRKAKNRLINCIRNDRETMLDYNKLKEELEKVLSRYVNVDGNVRIEIVHKDKNKRYIQAEACVKI